MLQDELSRHAREFILPDYFSLTAYFTFGVTGALAGLRRGYDVVGVFVLALITAGGGGLIRDGLLISSGPPSMLTDPRYLVTVGVATLATLVLHASIQKVGRAIAIIDALGLGAFAVHGVQVSLHGNLSQPGAILGGAITCVGGGLLRDILVRDEPLLFKPGQFYALVAIGGCVLFLALLRWDVTSPYNAALITIGATFAIRMLAIRFNWRTTALYREPTPPPDAEG
jgi:uncharacterized membrane protein YeiH